MILGKTNNALTTTRAVCKQDRVLLVLDCLQTISKCFHVKMYHKKFEFCAVLIVLCSIRNSFISKHKLHSPNTKTVSFKYRLGYFFVSLLDVVIKLKLNISQIKLNVLLLYSLCFVQENLILSCFLLGEAPVVEQLRRGLHLFCVLA